MSASAREHDAMIHLGPDGKVVLISLIIHGKPIPQGSKKWVGRLVDDNKEALIPWRERVARMCRSLGIEPLLGPIEVELTFYLQRPKYHWGTGRNAQRLKTSAPDYQSGYPDLDKLCRAVFDAFTESALLRDDGQVAVVHAIKRYAETPGVHIKLRPL